MTEWIATARAAIDVVDLDAFEGGAEILVVATEPCDPLALVGAGANLWRRLAVEGPIRDSDLDESERAIVREMQSAGLASEHLNGDHRVISIGAPWLSSALHELVYALVASVAHDAGIDVVFIKGPMLHAQGLRQREHSGDVDVWVAPSRRADLIAELTRWGWSPVPFDFHESTYHSVTLEGSDWGCEIDVHFRFPGMAATPDEAFAVLVEGSDEWSFAGVTGRVPTVAAHASIFALHSIRPEPGQSLSPHLRHAAVRALQTVGEGPATEQIERFGAYAALEGVVLEAFPDHVRPGIVPPAPADWQRRFAPSSARFHLLVLRSLPWRERPRALRAVLWPSTRVARLSIARAGLSATSSVGVHFQRLRAGARQVFAASKSRSIDGA